MNVGIGASTAAALLLPSALLISSASPAAAASDSTAVEVTASAWYTTAVDPASALAPTPEDGLPLAVGPAGETKRSVVMLDLGEVSVAATAVLRVSAVTATSYGSPHAVQACLVTGPWKAGPGQELTAAPPVDCDTAPVRGVAGAASWEFDLSPLLARAAARSLAVALVPAPGATAPWQLTLAASAERERVGTARQLTPAAPSEVPSPDPPTGAADQPGAPVESEETASVATVPFLAGGEAFPDMNSAEPALPRDEPQLAGPPQAGGPVQQAATSRLVAPALPVNSYAWLSIPLGLLLLWRVARVVRGDDSAAAWPVAP